MFTAKYKNISFKIIILDSPFTVTLQVKKVEANCNGFCLGNI
jgi:hypothetical protein